MRQSFGWLMVSALVCIAVVGTTRGGDGQNKEKVLTGDRASRNAARSACLTQCPPIGLSC
jgi:hypothetical protein